MMPRTVVDFIGYLITDTLSQQPIRRITRSSHYGWNGYIDINKRVKFFSVPNSRNPTDSFSYDELFDVQIFQTEFYQCN